MGGGHVPGSGQQKQRIEADGGDAAVLSKEVPGRLAGKDHPIASVKGVALVVLLDGGMSVVYQHQPVEWVIAAFQQERRADTGGNGQLGQGELPIVMPPLVSRSERIEMVQRQHFGQVACANVGILGDLELVLKRMLEPTGWMYW